MKSSTPPQDTHSQNRRKAIKTALGGTAAAAVVLPTTWTTPVLNTILTPAHAQTSSPPVIVRGVYASIAPIALNVRPVDEQSSQFALLDFLIAPAEAQIIVGEPYIPEICATGSDFVTMDNGNSTLFIRVNDDLTVDFAIDSLGISEIDDMPRDPCARFTAVSVSDDGLSIPDVELLLQPNEFISLTDMALSSEGEISGMYTVNGIPFESDAISPICSGPFTARVGASFPMARECFGEI